MARRAYADFPGAADAEWCAHRLPDHEDLERAFDAAHAQRDADVAADIIEVLVLGANVTGRTQPALQRWQATRDLAGHAAPLARAKLLGWGNLAQGSGTSRLEQSAQRLQAWRQVPGEEGRRGLCVALAMHAVACQDVGDPGAADAALAGCLALESPAWPPRLRRRCSWVALTRLAVARDDDALPAGASRASARLAQAARTHLQLGCGLDAGRSLGQQCAALAEQAPDAGAWPEVQALAARALALLVPYPAQILDFAEALADWAARQGEPELAVHLLAGAAQVRHTQQLGCDRLTERAAYRAWQLVRAALDEGTLERCSRQGRGLSAENLRALALRWLNTAPA